MFVITECSIGTEFVITEFHCNSIFIVEMYMTIFLFVRCEVLSQTNLDRNIKRVRLESSCEEFPNTFLRQLQKRFSVTGHNPIKISLS